MKKFIAILSFMAVYNQVLAQSASVSQTRFIVDGGVSEVSINNPAFNAWAGGSNIKNVNPGVSGFFDLAVAGKWDGDLHLSAANPFLDASFEFGKRLTRPNSPIASYINVDYGAFDAIFNNAVLPGYILTPDQRGKQLQLRSSNDYIGLTSRNYLSRLQFYLGKRHQAIFTSGFYVTGGWMPFSKDWRYGYWTQDDADSSTFHNVRAYDVPNINNFFVEGGVFIGIGF
jgi:hypothetical protein